MSIKSEDLDLLKIKEFVKTDWRKTGEKMGRDVMNGKKFNKGDHER